MGWRDPVASRREVEIRGERVALDVLTCSYTRGERYQSESADGDVLAQTRTAFAFIGEHVTGVVGADYPADLEARCAWWADALDVGEALQLAAWVQLGDLSGKSVRRVSSQS